eukprot:6492683-Amphidinium_carterae.3
MEQYLLHGNVPGFKEAHGDNVHLHHGFHNRLDHCLYLAIHCGWNSRDRTIYGRDKPSALMVWRQSVAHIRRASMSNGMCISSIYFRGAEDISIEFVPNHMEANANKSIGQETAMYNLRGAMGQPIGVWNIDEWQRIDNEAQATVWLDHSISAWSQSDTLAFQ